MSEITPGMSKAHILVKLGPPNDVRPCTITDEFTPHKLGTCAQIYVYGSAAAPLMPEHWVIWFDARDYVIDRYHFVSP